MSYTVDLEAIKHDVALALQVGHTYTDRDGCSECGNKSVCHWCSPREEARRRLTSWVKGRVVQVP